MLLYFVHPHSHYIAAYSKPPFGYFVFFNVEGARYLSVSPANYRNATRWDKDTYTMGRKALKELSLAERQEVLPKEGIAEEMEIEGLLE